MHPFKNIIFDLDGTLSDPIEGILNSLRYALQGLGIQNLPDSVPEDFIGPPLQHGFQTVYQLDNEATHKAVALFREYYGSKGLFENRIYEGIPQLLASLQASGYSLFVATSKLEKYARLILEHFEIDNCFLDLAGADYAGTRTKASLIVSLMKKHQLIKTETVMIGDTAYDIMGAKEADIAVIAVGYGFGQRENLLLNKPEHFLETTSELAAFFLNY